MKNIKKRIAPDKITEDFKKQAAMLKSEKSEDKGDWLKGRINPELKKQFVELMEDMGLIDQMNVVRVAVKELYSKRIGSKKNILKSDLSAPASNGNGKLHTLINEDIYDPSVLGEE